MPTHDCHLSQLGFDRLLASETHHIEELRAHLAECEQCQARYAELEEQRRVRLDDAFVAERVEALMLALAESNAS